MPSHEHSDIQALRGLTGRISTVAFSPDGRFLAAGNSNRYAVGGTIEERPGIEIAIKIWDMASFREIQTLRGHSDIINAIAFSPDSRFLASTSDDTTVRIWDVSSWRESCILLQDTKIKTYDGGQFVLVPRYEAGYYGQVKSLAFSPDGRLMAAGDNNYKIYLWEVGTWRLLDILSGDERSIYNALSIAFRPDAHILAAGCLGNEVRLWDVRLCREIASYDIHGSSVNTVAYSPNGRWLASGGRLGWVFVWDGETGQPIQKLIAGSRSDGINSVVFRPDNKLLATSSSDHTIAIWGAGTWHEIDRLRSNNGEVNSLAFSPDGRFLAAGCDEAVSLWFDGQISDEQQAELRASEERGARLKEEQAAKRAADEEQEKLIARRHTAGECEICGAKLGFFDKLGGNVRCKAHR